MSSADMTKLYEAMPSKQTICKVADRYADILLGGFSNVEKNTETLTVDTVTQEVTVLEAYMDHADLLELAINVLEQIKQDDDVKGILEDLGPWYNDLMEQSMYSYYDGFELEYEEEDLYTELMAQVDEALADLQEQLSDADPENHLYLYTYLDSSNKIIGTKLVISGMDEPVSWLALEQAGQCAMQALFGDLQIMGSGSNAQGSYAVSVADEKLMDIRLENITQTSGTVYLEPSASLLTGIAEEIGMDSSMASMVAMADVVIRVDFENSDDASQCSVKILSNEVSLLEVGILGEVLEVQSIELPQNAVDSDDEEAAYSWLFGLDFAGLFTKLTDAGVPEDLLTAMLMAQ